MRNTLTNLIAFAAGAAIGSAVTWKLVKTKYERIAQEEIDSVKEVFLNRRASTSEEDTIEEKFVEATPVVKQVDIVAYANKLKDMGYTNYGGNGKTAPETEKMAPYVIKPEQFGDEMDHETISLNYYADGVLANDWDEVIVDVAGTVGLDSLNHFGEYENDTVFVRNDELKRDYEIMRDTRKFVDVVGNSPHQAGD